MWQNLRNRSLQYIPITAMALTGTIFVAVTAGIWGIYEATIKNIDLEIKHVTQYLEELAKQDANNVLANMRLAGEATRQDIQRHSPITNIDWDAPLMRTTIVIDPDGQIVADSRPGKPALGRNVIDREYFSIHLNRADSSLYVGPNVKSRVDGHWSLPFSIPIRDRLSGSLVSVVSSAVDPVEWANTLPKRSGYLGLLAAITDQDGVVLTTMPFDELAIGVSFGEFERSLNDQRALLQSSLQLLFAELHPDLVSPASAQLQGLPLAIRIFYPWQDTVDQFALNAIYLIGVGGVVSAIVIFAAFVMYRKTDRVNQLQTQFFEAIDASSEGIALFDHSDRLVLCNRVYRQIHERSDHVITAGQSLEQILRAGLENDVFPVAKEDREEWLKERLRQHRAIQPVEQRLSNGRWILVSERRTADGGTVGIRTDITDQKEREEALRLSEKRFQDFTATASDWVWETDSEHRFIRHGPEVPIEDYDGDLSPAIGRTRLERAAEEVGTRKWQAHIDDLNARRPFKDFRYFLYSPSVGKRLVSVSGIPVFSSVGDFQGYRGTGRDITEETRNVEKIIDLEKRFRVGFESITVGIVVADSAGKIADFNPAASGIFGYKRSEVIGRNVSILANNFDRRNHGQYMNDYLTNGVRKIIGSPREVVGRRKNGEEFPLKLGIAEMAVGEERQFIASIVDLSKERDLEARLRQSQKMDAVGQLVGGISHDFNNLLAIIIGNLELIGRSVPSGGAVADQVERALGAANRGANLTGRLLRFSRQDRTSATTINVHAVVLDLEDLLQKSITQTIPISLSLNGTRPFIDVDRGELEDALVNLCVNARDAMTGGGRITIQTNSVSIVGDEEGGIEKLDPGEYVEIRVVDTGSGMSPQILEKMFDPFFTTKDPGKGTGLGLSMVYSFVRRSGGRITVDSKIGTGTTIAMLFPVAHSEPVASSKLPYSDLHSPKSTGKETILIVDDEVDMAQVAESILFDLGYHTIVAHSGAEAVEVLRSREDISLLFSDVIMAGGMNGFELANTAVELRPGLAICFTSGYLGDDVKDSNAFKEAPLLSKPYSGKLLADFIRSVLDG